MKTILKTIPYVLAFSSAIAMTDLTVVNQLPEGPTVSLNDHAVASGASKTEGINVFTSEGSVAVCSASGACQQITVKDDHRVCGYRVPPLANPDELLAKIRTHYAFDLLVDGQRVGTMCAFGSRQAIFFGTVPVSLTLSSTADGQYTASLTGDRYYTPQLYTIDDSTSKTVTYTGEY